MHPDVERILISEEQLQNKVKELAKSITKDNNGKKILLITELKGGIKF